MKKYDKYKPTGSPWIGEIPEHWEVKKLSYIGGKITDFVASGSFADLRENVEYLDEPDHAMLVRTADLSQKGNTSPVYVSKESYTFLSNSNLFGGEIILPNIGSVGDVYIVPKDLYPYMTLAPNAIMLNTDYNPYLYYYFLSKSGCEAIKNIAQGTTQSKFNKTELRALKVIIPPQSEQESIVAYLDEKCGSVDKVIAKQERRIALLKELKQSIISEAVTRGINPDAPLKATGIEWIGQIPEHWEVMPLKRTGSFGNGLTYSPDELCDEDGILVLRSSNIQNDKLCFEDNVYVKGCSDSLMVTPGDIIICSRNGSASLVGKCAMVENELYATFGAFMMRYRPLRKANKKFSYYMLQAALKLHKGLYSTTTINQLTNAVIDQITVSYPPFSEQEVIAKYLDEKCGRFDILISKATREIELLKEYKQSIITEAVTGKIKVC